MSETIYALVELLADSQFHSGESLGSELGISRAAVWKALQQFPTLGLEVQAVHGRGYRLSAPLELLDKEIIYSLLEPAMHRVFAEIELFNEIDSTSRYLRQAAEHDCPSATVCLAEFQSEGRGRRGRSWHSPYGSNIYLSLLWRFNDGMGRLGGLSLAVAVALMRCFDELGGTNLGIKWPNDILHKGGKLAGILVDVAGETGGPCYAVIGIGANYAMPATADGFIDQAWSHLKNTGISAGRNQVIASLLKHLVTVVMVYQRKGFEPFRDEWRKYDLFCDREATLQLSGQQYDGIVRGIDDAGMLLFECNGRVQHYAAGEVSLRMSKG